MPVQSDPMQQEFFVDHLERATRWLPEGDPYLEAVFDGRSPRAAAERIAAESRIGDDDFVAKLLDDGEAAVRGSDDVAIRINDAEIARAYSRADCDGSLLVAQLPNTAQGWHNVVPRIDFSRYEVRYVYDGSVYDSVPTLQRLRDWLVGTLPGRSARRELVIGLAETGPCELTSRALPAFAAKLSAFKKESGK